MAVFSEVRVAWCYVVKKGLVGLTFWVNHIVCNGKLTLGISERLSCKYLCASVRASVQIKLNLGF